MKTNQILRVKFILPNVVLKLLVVLYCLLHPFSGFSQVFNIAPVKPQDTLQMSVNFRVLPTELQLFYRADPAQINPYNFGSDKSSIVWESLNNNVARVDQNGLVTPVSIGQTVIKAFLPEKRQTSYCEVTVYMPRRWGNTNSALVQGGLMAEQNNWIYYANPYDGMKLYKIKTDGTGKGILSGDQPSFINVIGRWVYYYAYSPQRGLGIHKVSIDGGPSTKVRSTDRLSYLRVLQSEGVIVAFIMNDDLEAAFQVSLTRPNNPPTNLIQGDPITSIVVNNDAKFIYYTKWWENFKPNGVYGGVFKYNLQTGKSEVLVPVKAIVKKISLDDEGWVYYDMFGSKTSKFEWDWSAWEFRATGSDPVPTGLFRIMGDKHKNLKNVDVTTGFWSIDRFFIYYNDECVSFFKKDCVEKLCAIRRMKLDGTNDKLFDILPPSTHSIYYAEYGFYSFNNKLYITTDNFIIETDIEGINKKEMN